MELDTAAEALAPEVAARTLAGVYAGPALTSPCFTPTLAAGREALAEFDPRGYAATRNRIGGNVSRLNPYVTWGLFTPVELQRAVKRKTSGDSRDYQKFLSELGWKSYFRTTFLELGERVYRSLEPYKYPAEDKLDALPDAIATGRTGLACIDEMVVALRDDGYLHNHQRLWLAAYVVHFAKVHWPLGERFFYHHLIDGEPGPNALNWQWVASTFSQRPYYFNSASMAKHGHTPCPGAPFDASYAVLSERFFDGYGRGGYAERPARQPRTSGRPPLPQLLRSPAERPVVLLHAERLSERAAALQAAPGQPVVVALDGARLRAEAPSFKRLYFAVALAADLVRTLRADGRDATLLLFDDLDELVEALAARGASVVAPDSWHPGTWRTLKRLDARLRVAVVPDEPFAPVAAPLQSFAAYWRKAQRVASAR